MTYVVAFDDSPLARAALDQAVEFASATGENVVAVTAIRRDPSAARERGWLEPDEPFGVERAAAYLADAVGDVDEAVGFDYATVDRYAPPGRVSRAVRQLAVENDASVVFVGTTTPVAWSGGSSPSARPSPRTTATTSTSSVTRTGTGSFRRFGTAK